MFVLCAALLRKIDDWDIWYHLSIGREIFRTLKIPAVEIFIYPLIGEPGSYHEWGFGLLFYTVYRFMGYWGIAFLNALIGAGTLYLLYRAAHKDAPVTAVPLLVLGIIFLGIEYRIVYRPEMILFLFMAAEIYVLERFDQDGKFKWLLWVPLFLCLLSNFHPSAIIMLGILCSYSIHYVNDAPAKGVRRVKLLGILLLIIITSFLAAVLNPYGFTQVFLPLKFMTQVQGFELIEFEPTLLTNYKWYYVMLFLASIISLIFQPRRRLVDWILFAFFAYLGFKFVRNVALFSIVMYVPISKTFTYYAERPLLDYFHKNRLVLWIISTALISIILVPPMFDHSWGAGLDTNRVPVECAEKIARLKPSGQIFNFYHTGGYLTWRLYDQYRVFLDGRRYYMDKAFTIHNEVISGTPGWDQTLEKYGVSIIITTATFPYSNELIPLIPILADDKNWLLVAAEPGGLLFLKDGSFKITSSSQILDKKMIWQQVINESETTLHDFPQNANSYYVMGQAYVRLEKYTRAIKAYKNYLRIRPGDEQAAQMLYILESSTK